MVSYDTKKYSSKQLEVDILFAPDKRGISEWVSRDTISANHILNWGSNGVARHGVYFGDNRYIWEKAGKRRIEWLRTTGFSDNHLYGASRPIRKDIHAHHKSTGCVVCGSNSSLVTDHKNDLYNDIKVLSLETQTLDDFQCLCNHCNLQKRQVCKTTMDTGIRVGASTIPSLAIFGVDFTHGDESFNPEDVDAMVGTYWHDPIDFMRKIKKI